MQFDIIIGNPPYQEMTGGGNNGGRVIYNLFIENAIETSDKVCMIIKNNWMNSDSLKTTREKILQSGLKEVINYSLLGDIFTGMGIAASIIYIDKNNKDNGILNYTDIQGEKTIAKYIETLDKIKKLGYIPTSKIEMSIAEKVKSMSDDSFGIDIKISPFGINTNGNIPSGGCIDQSEIKTDEYNIPIKYIDDIKYTNIDNVPRNIDKIDKYKIICPKQIHKTNNPIPSVIGLLPGQICTASYCSMYYSDNQEEAFRVYQYIKTKLFRYLVYCLSDTLCGMTSYRASLVPLQDFTSNSDIDWSQSVENIDKQLYKKYKLTQDEINYIENTIKPMN